MTRVTTRTRSTTRAEMQHRAQWTPIVNTGTITCDRCHELIKPDPAQPHGGWEMGHPAHAPYATGNHDPRSRRPQHTTCNRTGIVLPEPEPPTFDGW